MAGVKGRSGRKDLGQVEGIATRFKPGQTGNPAGSSKRERLTALLRRKLEDIVNPNSTAPYARADVVVDALIDKAATGDTRAIELVWDRSDGKVADKLNLNGNLSVATLDLSRLSMKELLDFEQLFDRASTDDSASNA